ncbi:MAG: class I SAM-dependent methyltransferase [Solirubrobacterales bacterium]
MAEESPRRVAEGARRAYKPALSFDWLTPLFDPVVALTARERGFKRRVLEKARLHPGEQVLDLGCGTGTLAIGAKKVQPPASVVGLDADPAQLDRARAKAARAGAEVSFDEGFSTELPYADGRFEVVLSTLFFHHLRDDDKRRTLSEVLRVLKPGGRLVLGDVGRPQDPLMRFAVRTTVQTLDGRATTSANVDGMLPGMLEDAGLAEVGVEHRLRAPIGTLEVLTAVRPS